MKKGDARRGELLAAAERLFYTKGYEQTSVQDILDEISRIKQFVDQIERRALKIPAESADPVLINDFYSRILSLKLSATETAIFGII